MKKLKPLLGLAAVTLLLAGCGSGAESTSSKSEGTGAGDEITVWAWDPAFNLKALEVANELYTADNPEFKLNVIENAQADIDKN